MATSGASPSHFCATSSISDAINYHGRIVNTCYGDAYDFDTGQKPCLLARRDKIVKFFEDQIAAKGEAAVLFDLPRVGQACGIGLK